MRPALELDHPLELGEQALGERLRRRVAEVAARAAAITPDAVGGVYNVGGGCRVSVNDALSLLAGYADRPLDVRYEEVVCGDVRDTGADTTRARSDLGYAPAYTFADGLLAEFEWMVGQERNVRIRRAA